MKNFRKILGTVVFILAVSGNTRADEAGGIVYQNRFETPADSSALNDTGSASSEPVVLEKAPVAGDAVEGKASLLAGYLMRREGYFYPQIRLSKPVSLENGPLYLSGWVKILEQNPEANHALTLMCGGIFPRKQAEWKGFYCLTGHSKDLPNGWTYFWSEDISAAATEQARKEGTPFEGAAVTEIFLRMWNMRPGEILRFRVDDLRLTRFNPIPDPDTATWTEAQSLYHRMLGDKPVLKSVPDPTAAEFTAGLQQADNLLRDQSGQPDRIARALFVGKVLQLERPYWRLKLLHLALE